MGQVGQPGTDSSLNITSAAAGETTTCSLLAFRDCASHTVRLYVFKLHHFMWHTSVCRVANVGGFCF